MSPMPNIAEYRAEQLKRADRLYFERRTFRAWLKRETLAHPCLIAFAAGLSVGVVACVAIALSR